MYTYATNMKQTYATFKLGFPQKEMENGRKSVVPNTTEYVKCDMIRWCER